MGASCAAAAAAVAPSVSQSSAFVAPPALPPTVAPPTPSRAAARLASACRSLSNRGFRNVTKAGSICHVLRTLSSTSVCSPSPNGAGCSALGAAAASTDSPSAVSGRLIIVSDCAGATQRMVRPGISNAGHSSAQPEATKRLGQGVLSSSTTCSAIAGDGKMALFFFCFRSHVPCCKLPCCGTFFHFCFLCCFYLVFFRIFLQGEIGLHHTCTHKTKIHSHTDHTTFSQLIICNIIHGAFCLLFAPHWCECDDASQSAALH